MPLIIISLVIFIWIDGYIISIKSKMNICIKTEARKHLALAWMEFDINTWNLSLLQSAMKSCPTKIAPKDAGRSSICSSILKQWANHEVCTNNFSFLLCISSWRAWVKAISERIIGDKQGFNSDLNLTHNVK